MTGQDRYRQEMFLYATREDLAPPDPPLPDFVRPCSINRRDRKVGRKMRHEE
jgi:hypothetical protein